MRGTRKGGKVGRVGWGGESPEWKADPHGIVDGEDGRIGRVDEGVELAVDRIHLGRGGGEWAWEWGGREWVCCCQAPLSMQGS